MAGEIQLNSTTMATESSGSITLSNVNSATNRTNLGLGSMATQNANAVALTGGSLTGTEIDLKSSGDTIYASNGTTALLSESGGTVTLGNVTLANTVTLTDEYYLQGELQANYTSFASNSQINFDGSTAPYWNLTGDTTNFVQGDSISDLKIIKSGIYLIVVNIAASLPNPDSERYFAAYIRGVGTGSTSTVAQGYGQVINADGGTSRGGTTASAIRNFNANDQINIYVESVTDGNIDLISSSHFSICLIRPL